MTAATSLCVARAIALELEQAGAVAVLLSGSHARGAAEPESDIDIHALGVGPEYTLLRRANSLVSISWRTVAEHRAALDHPASAGVIVPAWRRAIILRDPDGVAALLQTEAHAWDWSRIDTARRDAWAAEELTCYAEEVHKLVTNRARGRWRVAGIQRAILALRLARVMAPHLALLVESEDELWDTVAARLGPAWQRAQTAALSEGGETLTDACDAALELFVLAARELTSCFDDRQLAVVSHACMLAGRSLAGADG